MSREHLLIPAVECEEILVPVVVVGGVRGGQSRPGRVQ